MSRVDLIYFNAGGGHRAAARALLRAAQSDYPEWDIKQVNLFDVFDPYHRFQRLVGLAPEDYYNLRLRTGMTAGLAQELKVLQSAIRWGESLLVERLLPYWLGRRPDLVVSLIPNFNRALAKSLGAALPGVPFLTVMTDIADFPPDFWMAPDTRQQIAFGSERAEEQARQIGFPGSRIHRISGMVLHPDFYRPLDGDREAARASIGLLPDRPTGVVMFGGHGAPAMLSIAEKLDDVQLILMCGHNEDMVRRINRRASSARHIAIGFTQDVPKYLRLADFFIGKPGPGSISEALHLGLPVVTIRNAWTMPQERYNAEWLVENNVGLAIRSVSQVPEAVRDLLLDLSAYRDRVACHRNRAVFEVVSLMNQLLTVRESGPAPQSLALVDRVRIVRGSS
jgi:1,2-diacylglycerol 3-beta-galactosyltransferase